MIKIIPVKMKYDFCMHNHTMQAVAEHLNLARRFSFHFDDKVVSEKVVPEGDLMTDDDWIRDLVENYCKNNTGVYADLFKRHSDKVHLVSKTIDFVIEDYGINLDAHVTIEKGIYNFKVKAANSDDVFSGSFKAENFSEVLEKIRIFTSVLGEMSKEFSANLDELSNDKVEEWIKWS